MDLVKVDYRDEILLCTTQPSPASEFRLYLNLPVLFLLYESFDRAFHHVLYLLLVVYISPSKLQSHTTLGPTFEHCEGANGSRDINNSLRICILEIDRFRISARQRLPRL